jgi:hypothetical protein
MSLLISLAYVTPVQTKWKTPVLLLQSANEVIYCYFLYMESRLRWRALLSACCLATGAYNNIYFM